MSNTQKAIGSGINQTINTIVVDEKYISEILSLSNHPSHLNQVILSLFESIKTIDISNGVNNLSHPRVNDKIAHNNIKKYRFKIEAIYSENCFIIESAYENLDSYNPGNKKILLDYINSLYLEILGEISSDVSKSKIEIINENDNGDLILEKVLNKLILSVFNLHNDIPKENLVLSLTIIVYHAFVECKILENPNV